MTAQPSGLPAPAGDAAYETMEAILRHTHVLAAYLDARFNFVLVNAAFASAVGEEPSFFPGKNQFELYPNAENRAIFQRVVDTGEAFFVAGMSFEFPCEPERGITYWDWSLIPATDKGGRVIGLVFTASDVTRSKRAEETLRKGEEQNRMVLQAAMDGFWVTDTGGRLLQVNEAYCRMSGYAEHELLAMHVWDVEAAEKAIDTAEHIRRVIAVGQDRFKSRHRHKDGGEYDVEVSVRYRPVDGGRLVAFLHDISEQERAEKALTHSRDLMRYIIEHNRSAIAVHDRDLNYVYVSQRYLDEYGVKDPDIIGKHHYEVFPDLPQKWRDVHQKALAGQISSAEDDPYVREDGSVEWTRWECRPWYESDGSVGGIIIYTEVITERMRDRMELERLRSAIEQSGETIVITNAEGAIAYANPAFEKATGYARSEVLGRNPRILKSGAHDQTFYSAMWKTLSEGLTWHGRLVNKRKDGSLFTEDASISPILDVSGAVVNYVAVKRDITEQLRMEREKAQVEEQYRQSQKVEAIGRLAGGVAHDLNNLLTPILGYGDMLLGAPGADDATRQQADEIVRAGLRARDLVRQLLAFGRKQTLQYKPLDLNKAVKGFEKLLRRTIREDIRIEIVLAPHLPPTLADAGQIEQVIMNLSLNAQDAMPKGGGLTLETGVVEIDRAYADAHSEADVGTYVALAVSDTGCGMSEEVLQHVFEPFFSTKGELGTGLGLSTVYGIVRQHGGSVRAYSEPGVGATFTVYLPVSAETGVEESAGASADASLGGSETILLAEDNGMVRNLAHTILSRRGYTVLAAANAGEALALLDSHPGTIHVLLTDVVMPDMNGRDLFAAAARKRPDLKVLYMSGYPGDVIANRGVLDERIAFIQKPFSSPGLVAKVREVLDRR